MKVGLFIPCYVNAVYPNIGIACYKLLTSLGIDVDYPLGQTCCGQPMANAGFEGDSLKLAKRFEQLFKNYTYVVGPSASCVAFVKENHPRILSEHGEHVCETSKHIYDIKVGNLPALVKDNYHGYLVPPGDEAAFVLRVQRLLSHPERLAAFSHHCLATWSKNSSDIFFTNLINVYQQVESQDEKV